MTTSTATQAIPSRGEQLPGFSGTTDEGKKLGPRDYYMRRNLALVFVDGVDCQRCNDFLRGLARQYPAVQAEASDVLVVVPADIAAASTLRNALDLPFPVIADADRSIVRRYGLLEDEGATRFALFIADRYGVIFETSIADDEHEILPADEVPGWLEFIACRCS